LAHVTAQVLAHVMAQVLAQVASVAAPAAAWSSDDSSRSRMVTFFRFNFFFIVPPQGKRSARPSTGPAKDRRLTGQQ
jgi:hypothetical protein